MDNTVTRPAATGFGVRKTPAEALPADPGRGGNTLTAGFGLETRQLVVLFLFTAVVSPIPSSAKTADDRNRKGMA